MYDAHRLNTLCFMQDVLQIISMFASFKFKWPGALTTLYDTFSFANFNIELLAPECSFTISYSTKWFLTESIPVMLVCTVVIVLISARVFQLGQRLLLGRLPTGATSDMHLIDICLGILLTGLYYVYFGECVFECFFGPLVDLFVLFAQL